MKPDAAQKATDTHPVLWLAPIGFLIGAVAPLPIGYFTILRVVVSGAAALLAFQSYSRGGRLWPWILGGTALLFNPVFPFYLGRDLWLVADFLAAVLFATHYWREGRIWTNARVDR